MLSDSILRELELVMARAAEAFEVYRTLSVRHRSALLYAIAQEIDHLGDALIQTAHRETNLDTARLRSERSRMLFQFRSYADATVAGTWMDLSIHTAIADHNPPRPDLRKRMVPLGPVVVFGASNFPFAYATAGGDTAAALAAGCTVIVKAHPAHPLTARMLAGAIEKAIEKCDLPAGVFAQMEGADFELGKKLVQHPIVRAVAFTGSFAGGKQLFDWAQQRTCPIPVFAEMGSVNPVYLMPRKLETAASEMALQFARSITSGAGQFCTKPGLLIGLESDALTQFTHDLGKAIRKVQTMPLLHEGIAASYARLREEALMHEAVHLVAESDEAFAAPEGRAGIPTLATTDGATFLSHPGLQEEIFGPFSLIVHCKSLEQVMSIAQKLEGQLTGTLLATEEDLKEAHSLISILEHQCGRLILNGVPTGVEVCKSMQHGGPFPASTDSRFTAVGSDGIKRFARAVCYQNWSPSLLPDELKNENPLNMGRWVNDVWTRDAVK